MDLETALKGVIDTRKRLESAWGNPTALLDVASKMGAYNMHLGDHLGRLKHDRELERNEKYIEYINEGMSATGAENKSRADVAKLTAQLKKIEITHKDVWSQVNLIQTQVRDMQREAQT